MNSKNVAVVGLGEVGKPLLQILSQHYSTVPVDILLPEQPVQRVDVLHICFPFEIPDFVGETARYIGIFQPEITIINSTVGIGTTRAVAERTGTSVVNSPVRGKHVRMQEELQKYVKFIGATTPAAAQLAADHFHSAGIRTKVLSSPEASELAKLTETTYFGLLIAWAQELERYCDSLEVDYNEVVSIYEEIKFLPPVKYTPGVIGGHCVMPNIDILRRYFSSEILDAIRGSNRKKIERDARKAPAPDRTLAQLAS